MTIATLRRSNSRGYRLNNNCMMLQQTPQMLKNQGSTKKTQWITWHSSSESSILCWITQCCKATWRNELERRGAGTHCGQLKEPKAPYLTKISFHFSRRYQFIFVYFSFENIILHTENYHNYSMLWNVPRSWFYRQLLSDKKSLTKDRK